MEVAGRYLNGAATKPSTGNSSRTSGVTGSTVTGSAVTFLSITLGLVGAWLGARIGKAFVGGSVEDGEI